MSYIIGNSGLTLPKLTGKMSKNREISPQAIMDWCSQLALSDLTASTKALYLTLQDSHQAQITYQVRFEILSLLRPTLKYISQALQKSYDDEEVLNENHRAIADLVNALHFEMLNGYKLILDEASQQLIRKNRIFIASMQNAISICSKILFFSYEQHRMPPEGTWLELHTLYKFAKKNKIATKTLKKYLTWQSRFNTIADIYKHCLLFSIANPTHLRRVQITQLLYSLENWAPLVNIKDIEDIENCLFVVEPSQDDPPRYIGLFEHLPEDGYFLDLVQVNERIAKLISVHTTANHEKIARLFSMSELALPLPYLESIHLSFKNLRQRTSERLIASGDVNVCLGITACHWFLSKSEAEELNIEISTEHSESINLDTLGQPGQSSSSSQNKFQSYSCIIVNKSEKGFCLNWTQMATTQLQTGEIIGIEIVDDKKHKHWRIGAIRWLTNESSYSTLVGIEILSDEAIAVKARLSDAPSPYLVPTLLLPEDKAKHLPMRLIAPPLPFKSGNELELEYNNENYAVILQKSFSASASYQEFGLHFTHQQIQFLHHHDFANQKELINNSSN